MRIILFFLFSLFTSSMMFGQYSENIVLKYPKVIISGISNKVYIDNYEYLKKSEKELMINHKLTEVKENNGEYFFEYSFLKDKKIIIENYNCNQPKTNVLPLWLSILPPLIAIIFALVFREVLFSLFSGIFVGSSIIGFYSEGVKGVFLGFFRVIDTYILESLKDSGHLSVIIFSILIGGIVSLISKNGGMKGVVNRIVKYANTPRSGQFATWLLGISIFFDDYANSLVVGNTMRPITDKLKVSREKLAYIVDSTAAPVASIAFVTTWIGAELGYIKNGVDKINENEVLINEGVYSILLNSLSYSFYPILTIFFIFYIIWRKKDFGLMYKSEIRARKGEVINPEVDSADLTEIEEIEPLSHVKPKAINAILPIFIIVFGTLIGLVLTGFENLSNQLSDIGIDVSDESYSELLSNLYLLDLPHDTITQKIGTIIGLSDSYLSLLWSSMLSLFVALFLTISQKIMTFQKTIDTILKGFKTMIPAVLILIFAWSLAIITDELHTADFLSKLITGSIAVWLLPGFTFVLSALVAFSTGSSWSTMALIYPLILPITWNICVVSGFATPETMTIFYITVSTVIAGSVLGDHCSPISDTTILSSLASGCNHIDHVKTQIPYALVVGFVSLFLGIIPSSLGLNSMFSFIISAIVLVLIVEFIGKKTDI